MVDDKVCNAVTSISVTQRCFLCQATSKEFNNIDAILKREVDENQFVFWIVNTICMDSFFRFVCTYPTNVT